MRRTVLHVLPASLLLILFAGGAAAHGGRFTNQQPALMAPPGRAQGLTKEATEARQRRVSWETWWEHNREVYLGYRAPLHDVHVQQSTKTRGSALIREKILPVLLEARKDKSFDVRSAAYVALGKTGLAELAEVIAGGRNDYHPEVRGAAALALGLLRSPESLAPLESTLVGKARARAGALDRARAFAATGLGFQGSPDALGVLQRILAGSEAIEVQAGAALGVGLLDGGERLEVLLECLSSHRSPEVRAFAAVSLGKLGDPAAAPELLAALADEHNYVRSSAALALGGIRPRPFRHEADIDRITRRLADTVKPLNAAERERVTKRLKELEEDRDRHRDDWSTLRRSIIKKLHRTALKIEGGSKRIRDRRHQQLPIRNFAAVSIGRLGGRDAVKALASLLRNARPAQVRTFACLGLGIAGRDLEGDTVRRLLEKTWKSARHVEMKGAVAIALGILGQPEAGPGLMRLLKKTRNEKVAHHMALALGMVGHRPAAPLLKKLLVDAVGVDLRRSAALGLALLRDDDGVKLLIKLLKGRSRVVQGTAAIALGLVGDRSALDPLLALATRGRSNLGRAFAVVALGLLVEGRKVPLLARFAADNNYTVPVPGILELFDIL